ncbi:MAG: hypothetical protein N2V78_02020 [Methanophagales archaeon]|nr:hypothetical protein [Methanophagales archaeon]
MVKPLGIKPEWIIIDSKSMTKEDRPILIEILDASDFIASLSKAAILSKEPEIKDN